MSVVLDEQRFPIVVLTFSGSSTDAEVRHVFHQIDVYLKDRKEYVAIVDQRDADALSRSQRDFTAQWLKTRKDDLRRYNLGSAFVFSSPIFRFMLSGIFLVQPLPSPHFVTGDMEDAMRWAREIVARRVAGTPARAATTARS